MDGENVKHITVDSNASLADVIQYLRKKLHHRDTTHYVLYEVQNNIGKPTVSSSSSTIIIIIIIIVIDIFHSNRSAFDILS